MDALIEAGHWKRARHQAQLRLRANSADAQAHVWMSKIEESFGNLEGSLGEAELAVAANPASAATHGQLAEACAMLADRSNILKGLGYVRRMKKEIDAALAIDGRHVDTLLVEMMFSFKAPAMAGGDKKRALRIADQITAASPAWGYLAHARLAQNNDDAIAEKMLLKAVATDPALYRARAELARFYCCQASQPQLDRAERAGRECLRIDPGAEPGYEVLARVYARERKRTELDRVLAEAEHNVAEDRAPFLAAARELVDIGQDFPRAERYLQMYLAEPPEGREPSRAETRWVLALLYEKEGRKMEAVRELEAAIRLQPDFEQAKRDLRRIEHA